MQEGLQKALSHLDRIPERIDHVHVHGFVPTQDHGYGSFIRLDQI